MNILYVIDSKVEIHRAPVAQLDRVPGFEPGGRRFESFRARHFNPESNTGLSSCCQRHLSCAVIAAVDAANWLRSTAALWLCDFERAWPALLRRLGDLLSAIAFERRILMNNAA